MNSSNLMGRIAAIRARVQAIAPALGDPRYMAIALDYQGTQTLITPKAYPVDPRKITAYQGSSVDLMTTDIEVIDIDRTIPASTLHKAVWLLGAVIDPGTGLYIGDKADCISLDESKASAYKAIVRPYRAR
jgi:hypothetical protein